MTYSPTQQAIIERFNRTIKTLIFSYISKRRAEGVPYSGRYYDKLQDFVFNYNNSYHSTIKDTPTKIFHNTRTNYRQELLVKEKLKEYPKNRKDLPTLNLRDHVRLHILTKSSERKADIFAHKYEPRWSSSIYEIVRRKSLQDPI